MANVYQITITNWSKHNPRKDVKRPSWFAFDNRMVEDADFFDFNHAEFKAWIYILSRASQKQSGEIVCDARHADQVCNIKISDFSSAIQKLKLLNMITLGSAHVTRTSRARHVHVRDPYATNTHTDITDITHTTEKPSDVRTSLGIIYSNFYPRKEGKELGIRKALKEIKTEADLLSFETAVIRYKDHCAKNRTEAQYIKHFSSFVSSWREWLDPETGTATAAGSAVDAAMEEMRVLIEKGADQ